MGANYQWTAWSDERGRGAGLPQPREGERGGTDGRVHCRLPKDGIFDRIVVGKMIIYENGIVWKMDRNGLFSDQKGGNKLLSVAEISARQVLCCYQMLLPDGAGVARSLSPGGADLYAA